MTTEMFWTALLLALVVQGVVIYAAIRFALIHDRALRARETAAAAAKVKWKAQAEQARAAAGASPAT